VNLEFVLRQIDWRQRRNPAELKGIFVSIVRNTEAKSKIPRR